MRRAEVALAEAERARATVEAALDALPPAKAKAASAAGSGTGALERATYKNPFAVVHDDPEVQSLWFASRRAALLATYGPLFRALNLSSEKVAQFQEIALRREQQNLDLTSAMWAQGLSNRDPALGRMEEQVKADYDSAMAELLGGDGAKQMQAYELALPVRKISTALAGLAAMSGAPLTYEQGEELTRVLTDACWRYTRTGATDPQTVDWPAVDARARTFLSAAQLKLFQTVEPEDGYNLYMFRFGSQVSSRLNRAKRAAAGLPEVSAPVAKPSAN